MELEPQALPGLFLLHRVSIGDDRGFFERMFGTEELDALGLLVRAVQVNRTLTRQIATVRGMHAQRSPFAEMKLVTCTRGRVFDVAVDLRIGSPTFGRWHGVILDAADHQSFVIPAGFAHGFQTLEDDCEMFYVHDAPYRRESEMRFHHADPFLAIEWPMTVSGLSPQDEAAEMLQPSFRGIPC